MNSEPVTNEPVEHQRDAEVRRPFLGRADIQRCFAVRPDPRPGEDEEGGEGEHREASGTRGRPGTATAAHGPLSISWYHDQTHCPSDQPAHAERDQDPPGAVRAGPAARGPPATERGGETGTELGAVVDDDHHVVVAESHHPPAHQGRGSQSGERDQSSASCRSHHPHRALSRYLRERRTVPQRAPGSPARLAGRAVRPLRFDSARGGRNRTAAGWG